MLEELLKGQVRGDAQLAGMLTRYGGKPAFFYQKAPPDTDARWNKPGYPRADYNIDRQYDPERKASGTLTVNVWCSDASVAMPEDVEKRLVALISGTFYTPPGEETVCAVWSRSDAFALETKQGAGKADPEIFGVTVTFDLLAFPDQHTTDPDPVQGAHAWTKAFSSAARVVTLDDLPAVWRPTDAFPAVYWRLADVAADNRQSYAVNWYTCQLAVHIIAESVAERNRWMKAMTEAIQLAGEILLEDGSPMFIERIAIRTSADPLREGQALLAGRYGVLAQHRKEYAQRPTAPDAIKFTFGG